MKRKKDTGIYVWSDQSKLQISYTLCKPICNRKVENLILLTNADHGRFKVFSVIFRRFSIHYSTPFDETNLNRSKLIECLPITSEQHCLKIRVFAAFGCWTLVHVKNNNAQARFLLETAKLPILQIILVLSPASLLQLCLLTQST